MCAAKSNLEQLTDFFSNLEYLHKLKLQTEPIEKFKYLIIFFLSNFYYGIGMKKPLTPYLGETL